MHWFSPQDHSAPVIHPEKHAQSKHPGQPLPALPRQAVVFCLGKGLPLLQERFAPSLALDQLPGFITHSPVYQVEGAPHTCFLHGGYGAPQAACTDSLSRAKTLIKSHAIPMLTAAFKICSIIWETEVCTMVLFAWKYPRSTPSRPEKKIVGASARSTMAALPGIKKSAPKKANRLAAPPTTIT